MTTPDIVEVVLGPATNTVEVLVPGIRGPAGPNSISSSTATALTGILKANGTAIEIAVPGTDYLNNFDFVNSDGSQRFSVYQPPSSGNGYASLYFNSEGSSGGFQPLVIGANAEGGFYVGHGATQLTANAVAITINAPAYSIGYPSAFRTALGAQATLPSMTGQSGKFLTTNGTVESWGTVDLSTKQDAAAFLTTLAAINSTSGTGALARVTSPTLTTPTIARTNFSANTNVTEQASGIVQIGTTAANALGSLACAGAAMTTTLALSGTGLTAYQNRLTLDGSNYWRNDGLLQANQFYNVSGSSGNYLLPTEYRMGPANTIGFNGTGVPVSYFNDITMGRSAVGVMGFYTDNTKATLGSLACANVTASGVVTASGTGTHTFGTTNTVTMTNGALVASASVTSPLIYMGSGGPLLRPSSTVIEARNNANSAYAQIKALGFAATGTNASASVEINGTAGSASLYFYPGSASVTGKITNPSDGTYRFGNGADTARAILDFATSGTLKFRDATNAADVAVTFGNATASGQIISTASGSAVTLSTNLQITIETTSNTTGNIVYRGSDGVTRRSPITFS